MDLRDIGIDGMKWIQVAQDRVQWHGNEPSGSIKKARYFFDKLSDYQLFMEYHAPWSE
jgi:hypothetical protein